MDKTLVSEQNGFVFQDFSGELHRRSAGGLCSICNSVIQVFFFHFPTFFGVFGHFLKYLKNWPVRLFLGIFRAENSDFFDFVKSQASPGLMATSMDSIGFELLDTSAFPWLCGFFALLGFLRLFLYFLVKKWPKNDGFWSFSG